MGTEEKVKKKRGKKGDFDGERLRILEENLDVYREATKEGTGAVHTWFINVFFPNYWSKFHWSLPMDQDVPENISALPPVNDEELDVEQRKAKADAVKAGVKKIKTWFNYRRGSLGLNSSKDPWMPLLEKVRRINDAPPRRPQDCQYYMNMPEFKPKCDEEFEKLWPTLGLPNDYMVSSRVKVARTLLEAEPPELRKRIQTLVEESHARAMEEYKKGAWVPDNIDPEEQAQAISALTSIVQPLLDGIRAVTGMHLCLLAASKRANNPKGLAYILNAGKTPEGKTFATLDEQKFRQTVRNFCGYVLAAEGGVQAAGTDDDSDMLEPMSLRPNTHSPSPVDKLRSQTTSSGKTTKPTASPPKPSQPVPTPTLSTPLERLAKANEAMKKALDAVGIEACNELLAELSNLPPSEKTRRIHELTKISKYEVEIENNKARNRALARQLGIGDAAVLFGAAQVKEPERLTEEPGDDDDYAPATRGAGAEREGQARRSQRKKAHAPMAPPATPTFTALPTPKAAPIADAHPVNTSGTSSPSTNDGETAPLDGIAHVNTAEMDPLNGVANVDTANGHGAEDDKNADVASQPWATAPKWFTEGADNLSNLSKDTYCPAWFEAVKAWRQLEEASGFPEGMLGTTSRPVQVGKWIKSARPYKYQPEIEDTDAYAIGWWKWWRAINPDWRSESGGQRLARQTCGDWEALQVTGSNGTLSILASLWFWREQIPDTSLTFESWKEAVADVNWALHEVLRSKKRPAATEEDEPEDETRPSRKRARAA